MLKNKIFSNIINPAKINLFAKNLSFFNFSNSFKDKEQAEERIYVDKKEKEMMKKLLMKVNSENSNSKESQTTNYDSDDEEDLTHILERHHKVVSKELYDELIKWKRSDH